MKTIENRNDLLLGFKCLVDVAKFKGDVVINAAEKYFAYSFGRLNLIGLAIRHDINLKQLQFQKQRIEGTITALTQGMAESKKGTFNPAIQKTILLFKSNMVDVFRSIAKGVLHTLYLKSQAFK